MINLAKQSPRIEDKIIKWYCGDTFELNFDFEFVEDDIIVEPQQTETLILTVFNQYFDKIHTIEVHQTHDITLVIDDELTKKFPRGQYYYIVKRIAWYITTIVQENQIIVE